MDAPKLADIQWTWRRAFAFTVVFVTAALEWLIIRAIEKGGASAAELRTLGVGLLLIMALVVCAYMMGATATDIQRILLARHTTVQRTETGGPA